MDCIVLRNENELYHHGILGQKWGVRRYQNEDGTLTSAGAKRYAADSNKLNKLVTKSEKANAKYEKRAAKNLKVQSRHMPLTDIGVYAKKKSLYKTEQAKARAVKANQKIKKQVDSMVEKYGSQTVTAEQIATGQYYAGQAMRALDMYKN